MIEAFVVGSPIRDGSARARPPAHSDSRRRLEVKTFENATSLVLAMAAQVLAIGAVLALY